MKIKIFKNEILKKIKQLDIIDSNDLLVYTENNKLYFETYDLYSQVKIAICESGIEELNCVGVDKKILHIINKLENEIILSFEENYVLITSDKTRVKINYSDTVLKTRKLSNVIPNNESFFEIENLEELLKMLNITVSEDKKEITSGLQIIKENGEFSLITTNKYHLTQMVVKAKENDYTPNFKAIIQSKMLSKIISACSKKYLISINEINTFLKDLETESIYLIRNYSGVYPKVNMETFIGKTLIKIEINKEELLKCLDRCSLIKDSYATFKVDTKENEFLVKKNNDIINIEETFTITSSSGEEIESTPRMLDEKIFIEILKNIETENDNFKIYSNGIFNLLRVECKNNATVVMCMGIVGR